MTTQRQLDAMLNELRPQLQEALLAAFADMQSGVDYPALELAIAQRDAAGVEAALNIDDGSFAPYMLIAMTIYLRYGQRFGPTLGVRFTPNMSVIQADIADATARMTEDARQGIRDAVERRMMSVDGANRREAARAIIREIKPIIGLSRPQISYVESMRERLLSGDPEQMRAVLSGQKLRDKRYDRLIKRAIVQARAHEKAVAKALEAGLPTPPPPAPILTPAKVDEITGKYAARLLRKRATDIARAEVDQYAEAAKFEAAKKVVGGVTKTWRHSSIYINARPDHVGMSGVSVPIDASFIMADGTAMRYAHDPRGGARHNASCRCRTEYSKVEKV